MNTPNLFLNLIPESLVASTLSPQAYGNYMALGLRATTRGQAIFFAVDPKMAAEIFPVESAFDRCRKAAATEPKHSVYLSIYRVLEQLPLSALGKLYLVTDDGRVLGIDQGKYHPEENRLFHLYQEFLPVKPMVVSRLNPPAFCKHLTTPGLPVHLPKLIFSELVLHELANDPVHGKPENLPYPHLEHLRDCLEILKADPEKQTKLVIRHMQQELLYRTIRNGFFAGDHDTLLYYPLPPRDKLENDHREWWRSAQVVHME